MIGGACKRRAQALRPALGHGERDREAVPGWRKQVGDVPRRRDRIALRHEKRHTVRKDAASVHHGERSVSERFLVQAASEQSVRLTPE